MLFTISVNSVITDIYAASALYCIINSKPRSEGPEILSRDNEPALRRAVAHSFTHLCFSLLPFITDCNIDETFEGDHSLELSIPPSMSPAMASGLRRAMEEAVAFLTLAAAFTNYDSPVAETNDASARDTIDRIRRAIDRPGALIPFGLT